ncbi:YbaY family lipoprotein [Pseudomonas fluorescens]|uniref:Lipoprotein n=1 Tax=Pseudomonas fluorescens TaxID=294 RepID=A0A5E7BBP9_PSEFL|nr:YbaY family lipoprotein [Pseudomonas fluorescens]VVN86637.1 hypothetical protein PS691_01521 [Pseudomonas fluorescens]
MTSEPVYTLDGKVQIGLPANSTLTVTLQDVSLADAPAKELARSVTPNAETAGLDFNLVYAAANVEPGHSYAIQANIESNGQLIFTTTEHHRVEPDAANLQPLEILVRKV